MVCLTTTTAIRIPHTGAAEVLKELPPLHVKLKQPEINGSN